MQPTQTKLLNTKTFWVGLLAVAAALVDAIFGADDVLTGIDWGRAFSTAVSDSKLWMGLLGITGRHAIIGLVRNILTQKQAVDAPKS